MTRIIVTSALSLALAAVLVSPPAPAEAAHHCAAISAKAGGFNEDAVAQRARNRLKGAINRWARKAGAKRVGVRAPHVDCSTGKGGFYFKCSAKSYVCAR